MYPCCKIVDIKEEIKRDSRFTLHGLILWVQEVFVAKENKFLSKLKSEKQVKDECI